jgi:hypothetical protein
MRPVRFAPFLSHRSQGMPEKRIASHTINMQKSMDLMVWNSANKPAQQLLYKLQD